jgi:hypothetical protein
MFRLSGGLCYLSTGLTPKVSKLPRSILDRINIKPNSVIYTKIKFLEVFTDPTREITILNLGSILYLLSKCVGLCFSWRRLSAHWPNGKRHLLSTALVTSTTLPIALLP